MIQERIQILRSEGPPEIFDNTMLSNFTKCEWAFILFMSGLQTKDQPPYFTWGRAFGAALNTWHSLQGKMEKKERLWESIGTAQDIWEAEAPIVQAESQDSWDNLETTLKLYTEYYGEEEPWTMVYGKGELGFRFPLPGTQILYAGSIDAPMEWPPNPIYFREDKTTGGYITQNYMNQWDYSSQVTGYCWAFEQLLGEKPWGADINVISKKPQRDWERRFQRLMVFRDEAQIDRFVKETTRIVDNLRRIWDSWSWSKTGNRDPINCTGGMGRSPCPYRRLCLMEADPWDLEDFGFEEFSLREKWAPWERDGAD